MCKQTRMHYTFTQTSIVLVSKHNTSQVVCVQMHVLVGLWATWRSIGIGERGGSKLKDTSDGKAIEIKMTAMVRAREAERRQRGLAAERGRRAFFSCALTLLLFFLSFPCCIHFAQNSVAKREMSRPGRLPQSAAHVYKRPPTRAHS